MKSNILEKIILNKQLGKKGFALLLDPDKLDAISLGERIADINNYCPDYIFVGGSLISSNNADFVLKTLKNETSIPVIIFPGNGLHVNVNADGILLLSLISGRNPDYLIGQHVISAPILRRSNLEILPTGYMIVDGGKPTTVSYISNTFPLPNNKPEIAACTAMAGEMLGLKIMYLDAGSGAENPVSKEVIRAVKNAINVPLIVGGGLNTTEKIQVALDAGADIVVIGNAVEDNPDFLMEISQKVAQYNVPDFINA